MRILYIDTSSSYLYTAIVENDTAIAEIKEDLGQELSEKALPKIVGMFTDNDISQNSIDKIIVVDGPGSFTGIRVGITIAKVYAWALNIPISTTTSLESMAISNDSDLLKVPMIDARRKYVYAAIYKDDEAILKPKYIKLDELKEMINEDFIVITNDDIDFGDNKVDYSPNFIEIIKRNKDNENINPHMVNPNYLKLTEAEESKSNA